MKFRVVLVDDDAVVLFLHQVLVKRSGLPPVAFSCKNAREALEKIEENIVLDTPYLVLLDINMPVMNGWEFLNEIQEKPFKKNLFVAIVTSSINCQDRKKAREFPQVIKYIEKPLSVNELSDLCVELEPLIDNK